MPSVPTDSSPAPEPVWEIARLFPPQDCWTESHYLSFTESLNQLVELVDGHLEVLEMPTKSHQKIAYCLLNLLLGYLTTQRFGDAIGAPYRVRIRAETYREPDIVVYLTEHLERFGERYGEVPDLVVEVVSDDPASRARDYEDKRRDYAEAGIPEYWIVDPAQQRIVVLTLRGNEYTASGEYQPGQVAQSPLLPGLQIDVTQVLEAGQ